MHGERCPKCGSSNVIFYPDLFKGKGNSTMSEYRCRDCHHFWTPRQPVAVCFTRGQPVEAETR